MLLNDPESETWLQVFLSAANFSVGLVKDALTTSMMRYSCQQLQSIGKPAEQHSRATLCRSLHPRERRHEGYVARASSEWVKKRSNMPCE
jgi:hypothetical protein